MPSDLSSWLISAPLDGDSEGLAQELTAKLETSRILPKGSVAQLQIPALKTGTLDSLISLSEELPKADTFFTGAVVKIVDTLRNLLNNDSTRLAQHILVNERTVDDYLFHDWTWNAGRYGTQRSLREIVDSLNKEMTSIDNVMKAKLNAYNLAKGSLVQMQRKKTGNLSVRSLADVVRKEDVITDSEFMETVLVAVPKNSTKDWLAKYERLASMVVPRSSHQVATDEEYTLFAAVVFKRVKDEFAQKCRENKYILRDFVYSDDLLAKQQGDLQTADTMEKELWTDLLRLARTNFSEAFQVLFHFKVVRLFVESVLRYGLPANYIGVIIKPDPKSTKKLLQTLSAHFSYLASKSRGAKGKTKGGDTAETFGAEYQALMEEEIFDFVLFEIPWILT